MNPSRTDITDSGTQTQKVGENGLMAKAMVNGALGFSFHVGRTGLVMPRHAFHGRAQVTVTVPDVALLGVDLQIDAGKNHFDEPVTLQFDANACGQDCRMMVIEGFDESRNAWVPLETSVDAENQTLTVQIDHFTRFRAASEAKRVGW